MKNILDSIPIDSLNALAKGVAGSGTVAVVHGLNFSDLVHAIVQITIGVATIVSFVAPYFKKKPPTAGQ